MRIVPLLAAFTVAASECNGPERLRLNQVENSNLGGAGPDLSDAKSLVFDEVGSYKGRHLQLEIVASEDSQYEARSPDNGAATDEHLAHISMMSGTSTTFFIRLLDRETKEKVSLPKLNLTFYALNVPTRQTINASGYMTAFQSSPGLFSKDASGGHMAYHSAQPCQSSLSSGDCGLTFFYAKASQMKVTLTVPGVRGSNHMFYLSASFCNDISIPSAKCSADLCGKGSELIQGVLGMQCATEVCDPSECCHQVPGIVDYPKVQSCHGAERLWRKCPDLQECEPCFPVDCEFSAWSAWHPVGGCSGLCQRHRHPGQNNECGNPCSGHVRETIVRLDDPLCYPSSCVKSDEDCLWGAWESWSSCEHMDECSICQLAQRYRSREILVGAKGGGKACIGSWNETEPCQPSHAIDCELSEWAEWTTCSKSCGVGWQARMRRVMQEAKFGGRPCAPAEIYNEGLVVRQTQPCNQESCDDPVPCILSDWSGWEGCNRHSPYQKFRFRDVLQTEMNGGKACDVSLNQTAGCPEPLEDKPKPPCVFGDWSRWSECSATCGGQSHRSRSIAGDGSCVLPGQASRAGAVLKETVACGHRECSTSSCSLSMWDEWSKCTSECGIGATWRKRKILEIGDTLGCNTALEEVKACQDKECDGIDCLWGEWEDWNSCTSTCGGGIQRRNRIIVVSPQNGGRLCEPKDKYEVSACNTHSCNECVDGRWSSWGSWGKCSSECSPAYRVRHRNVAEHPNSCGKSATGVEDEYELCQGLPSCEADQDCALSGWKEWSDCSSKCFGVQERQRVVEHFARGNGQSCVDTSLKEVRACNPKLGESANECQTNLPKSCVIGSWEKWTECSVSCGGGHRSRVRQVLSPAANGGEACNTALEMLEPCAEQVCDQSICVDCVWEAWSDWGACTKCGGQRFRHRNIAKVPNHCGKRCDAKAAKELGDCHGDCEKTFHCSWSEWTEMGACSRSCGTGTLMRQRELVLSKENAYQDQLFFTTTVNSSCSGSQVTTEVCDLPSCSGCEAQDCAFHAWSEWSTPTCMQLCERHRTVMQESGCGGKLCSGSLWETKRCERTCNDPVDCTFGDWGAWEGECQSPTDQRYQHRSIERPAMNGGQQCHGATKNTQPCGGDIRQCELGVWSSWSICTASCDGGVMTRSREIVTSAKGGGKPCQDWLEEANECNTHACQDDSRDCKLGAWSKWTTCQEGPMKFRFRRIDQQPANTGAACIGALREASSCQTTVDCETSEWTQWDACDKTCGGGQQMRHRQVTKNPVNGGLACPKVLVETQGCALEPCRRRDCIVTEWASWTGCSATCGIGYRTRARDFKQKPCEGGQGCDLDLAMVEPCFAPDCECQDCLWDAWSEWSQCSKPCDGGQTTRERVVIQTPKKGCKACEALPSSQVQPCNTEACHKHSCVDGQWGEWSAWSACSATCQGGERWHHRHPAVEANDCGIPAKGMSIEAEACNDDVPCMKSTDCLFTSWGKWTECSGKCQGVRTRTRTIAVPAKGAGLYCAGPLEETAPCHNGGGLLDFADPTCTLDLSHFKGGSAEGAPGVMRYRNVIQVATTACPYPGEQTCSGRWVDLLVTSNQAYQSCITDQRYDGFGEITVPSGSEISFKFQLVDPITNQPVAMPKLMLKIFGLTEEDGTSRMSLFAQGFKDYYLSKQSLVAVSSVDGGGTFAASDAGNFGNPLPNSPADTDEMTESRTVALLYDQAATFDVKFQVAGGTGCHRFLFAVKGCAGQGGCCEVDPCHLYDKPAVDCILSDWEEWGECDVSCGAGQQVKRRQVVQYPSKGGYGCTSALSLTRACNMQACGNECVPVDCAWTEWSDYGPCNKCGGEMQRVRHIAAHPQCGGEACKSGAAVEVAKCPRSCTDKTFCLWTEWSDYGPCSTTCGSGIQSRSRTLHPAVQSPDEHDAYGSAAHIGADGQYIPMAESPAYEEIPVGSPDTPLEISPHGSNMGSRYDGFHGDDHYSFNGQYIDESELSKKFEELKLRTDHMEKGRSKVLMLAFGAGALSLGALATVVHVMRK